MSPPVPDPVAKDRLLEEPAAPPTGYRPSKLLTMTLYVISYWVIAILFAWLIMFPAAQRSQLQCGGFYDWASLRDSGSP